MYGGTENGYLLRVRSSLTLHGAAASNNGTIVWFPDFHNAGSVNNSNILYWEFPNTGGPANTTAVPLGTGAAGGESFPDPANGWVAANTVASARTIAACITFNYVGPTTSAAGQVAYNSGVQRGPVIFGGSAGSPASTAEYFVLTDKTTRTPLVQLENKFVPTDASRFFRTAGGSLQTDVAFVLGTPGTSSTASGTSIAVDTYGGIGFSWRGLSTASNNDVIIEFIKVIEWKPDPASGGQLPTAPQSESASWELFSTAVRRSFNPVRYGMSDPSTMDYLVQGVSNMALGAAGMAMRQTTQRMVMRA